MVKIPISLVLHENCIHNLLNILNSHIIMDKVLALRILLIVNVILYVLAIIYSGLSSSAPQQAITYEAWAKSQVDSTPAIYGILCLLGHLTDIIGLVLLFLRKKLGVYFLLFGFLSCVGIGSNIPSLETYSGGVLIALTNIFWGALISLVFFSSKELFTEKT